VALGGSGCLGALGQAAQSVRRGGQEVLSADHTTLIALIVLSCLVVVLFILYRREAAAKARLVDAAKRHAEREAAPFRSPGGALPDGPGEGLVEGRRGDPASNLPRQETQIIDRAVLDELLDALGSEDFAQVVDVFLADMPLLMDRLASAVLRGDKVTTFAAAHEGKGTAASLGLCRLADVMGRLEAAARTESHDAVQGLLDEAELVWTESAYALDAWCRN
jgi:HPt (histidine-containing phosphotransfer) domain-containing protein